MLKNAKKMLNNARTCQKTLENARKYQEMF